MKHLSIVRYVLMAISILSILLFFVGAVDVDLMLRWGYIMSAIAIACVILLPLYNLAQNPGGAVRSLIGLAVLVVIVGVCYAVSSDVVVVTPSNVYDNPVALRFSDTGLFATYFAMGASIIAIIVGEVSNLFK